MENMQVKTLCQIRDIYRSIAEFEIGFQRRYDICLNEGMLLCSLSSKKYSSSELATALGLTNSNASKVIKSVENKGLVERIMGESDKRQMYFVLTLKGQEKLKTIKCGNLQVPPVLESIIEK